jgi:hypothetical protein
MKLRKYMNSNIGSAARIIESLPLSCLPKNGVHSATIKPDKTAISIGEMLNYLKNGRLNLQN